MHKGGQWNLKTNFTEKKDREPDVYLHIVAVDLWFYQVVSQYTEYTCLPKQKKRLNKSIKYIFKKHKIIVVI